MTEKTSIHRNKLLMALNLVKPALATQAYIPALTHIKFHDKVATAYNDISAVSVKVEPDWSLCLPGDLLTKTLSSFATENISVQEVDQTVVVSSGRSKIKLPSLETKQFPFEAPSLKKVPVIELDKDTLRGLERCLLSVGNDPTHPAQMGVTLDCLPSGHAVLYSTDNYTLSRYKTKAKVELPGDSPVILPTFFCQQLVSLSKAFPDALPDLYVLPGLLVVKLGEEATLSTKTLVDLEPLEFESKFEKHAKLKILADSIEVIPDQWEAAFERALLVLTTEVDKVTKITVNSESLRLSSSSNLGDAEDVLPHSGDQQATTLAPPEPFYLDPGLVLRTSKVCTHMAFSSTALTVTDKDLQFVHVIAYCSK